LTWAKVDDGYDEELAHLSHAAFRLYTTAITYSRRRELGGFLSRRDVETLCRAQRIAGIDKVIEELLDGSADKPLWVREGDGYVVVAYEKYNPPTSTERVRRFRATPRNADETLQEPTVTPSPASARAPGPVPVPVPVQASNEALPPISPTTALSSAPNSAGVPRVKSDDVISVFEAFQERHPRAVLTDDRRKLIARFVKGHGAAVCIAATKGIVYSPHHMGDNDRGEKYDSLEAIFKNARNVELFSGYELDPGTRPTGHPRGRVERTIRGRELDPALLARAYPVLARD